MSGRAAAGVAVLPGSGAEDRAWGSWLAGRIDPGWRPGEWDPRAWLFTGDPASARTGVWACQVNACGNDVDAPSALCSPCRRELAASGQGRAEFAASHVPPRRRLAPGTIGALCMVSRDGTGCCRPVISHRLCASHYPTWRGRELRKGGPVVPLGQWARSVAVPYTGPLECLVRGCGGRPVNDHSLCRLHWGQWSKGNRPKPPRARVPAGQWAREQTPFLGARRFSLARLEPVARLEVLYGLQRRDELGLIIRPKSVRAIVRSAEGTGSVRGREAQLAGGASADSNIVALARQICWSAGLGFDEFRGVAPVDKDVLDLRAVGLKSGSHPGRRRHGGLADLTQIRQLWLRELFRRWVDASRPHSQHFGWHLRAMTIASRALAGRPGGGDDPAVLRFADMGAVADGFRCASRLDGAPYTAKHRGMLLGLFAGLLDFGRSAGLLDRLPGSFARHPCHLIAREDATEDELGKAIPEQVIAQLDAQLGLLGEGFPCYEQWPAEDVRAMLRCVYVVLRDTGRRPGEVACLPRDCLETASGQISLIWHNKKGRRNGRRLPVTAGTAAEIRAWQQRRAGVPAPRRSDACLFPAITAAAADAHMHAPNIALAIRGWVAALPGLHCGAAGQDGALLPFDRSRIFPYAFRHTYAQRHADAGTPVDVLKELMDHLSVATTMGYYQVSLKRKQAAVKALSAHATDRHGRPAPFSSPLAYQIGSVAVPYGGCTEPSNVKAGGKACPIRFQCAGCGFYRPDPSYLPAIEQQINDLKADRETAAAMDAAGYVISNLADQVAAYTDVAETMRTTLAGLPARERAGIEDASAVMRKARATAAHTALPLAITNGHRPDSTP